MNRRGFLKSTAITGAAIVSPAAIRAAIQAENNAGAARNVHPPLSGPFRLSPDWYRQNTARFQSSLSASGLDGAVIAGAENINYLTGSFATTTERQLWLYVPAKGEPAIFYPGLDRDLWQTWWIKDGEWYFDFHHHGEFNKVVYEPGAPVNLFQWMLDGIVKRGAAKKKIAFDWRLEDDQVSSVNKAGIVGGQKSAGSLLLGMRQLKTPEELALCRTSIELHDRMLQFARDYILQHGTDATDFEVSHASIAFGTHELMRSMPVTGQPHNGVGVLIDLSCRTGGATAYPHPNQFFFQKIKRGDALQIATSGRVGGYGGEGYRAMQIEGPGVGDLHRRMWETHTAMTLKQQELSKAGVACNQVGSAVLKLARDAGMEQYIYHRPAHGEGAEGHQPPYLSLGDTMVMQENMCFSNEPGLYSPKDHIGYNHSNFVVVGKERGEMFNRTPLTKEWCWIKI